MTTDSVDEKCTVVSKMHTAAILVGGESRRMGTDKARLLLQQTPLYMHVLRKIAPHFEELLMVGFGADELVEASGIDRVRAAPDIFTDRSSANGVYSALVAAGSPWCCILSCDAPFPCVPLLQYMKGRCGESAQVIATRNSDGSLNPFHAFWHTSAASLLETRINQGDLRLQKTVSLLNVSILEPQEWRVFDPEGRFNININTPQDLENIRTS